MKNLTEEPKQIKCYCGHTTTCDCSPLEPKQLTLKEAAERMYPETFVSIFTLRDKVDKNKERRKIFIEGANYQAERMYSEEEVIKIVEKSRETGLTA
jgi:hypothetical protein